MLTGDLTQYSFETIVKVRERKLNKIKTKQMDEDGGKKDREASWSLESNHDLYLKLKHPNHDFGYLKHWCFTHINGN